MTIFFYVLAALAGVGVTLLVCEARFAIHADEWFSEKRLLEIRIRDLERELREIHSVNERGYDRQGIA